MTTHEGAPSMPTLKPGITNVRVTKGDEVIFSGRCDVAQGEDGTWSLTPVPLPEEPAWWTIVRLNHKLWAIRDAITSANGGGNWLTSTGERHTWPEVCALGTPEVQGEYAELRERAEKAEREVEEFIATDIDRSTATEDEPAEPAPVEHLTHKAEYDERGVAFCRACGETGGQS